MKNVKKTVINRGGKSIVSGDNMPKGRKSLPTIGAIKKYKPADGGAYIRKK